jgi:SAM-dependent methyltransferase
MAVAGDVGITLEAADTPTLFGEDQGRYLIATSFDKAEALMVAAGQAGVPMVTVGRVGGDAVRIGASEAPLAELRDIWSGAFAGISDERSRRCQPGLLERHGSGLGRGGRTGLGLRQVSWGNWSVPETELHLLPEDMSGMDAIELGCGTGYVSAWMARRGARVTGIDVSAEQLATARRLMASTGSTSPFWRAMRRRRACPMPVLRFRDFRIRGRDLVRSGPLAARGAPPAPSRRDARVPRQPPDDIDHHAAEWRALRAGSAPALPRPHRRRLDARWRSTPAGSSSTARSRAGWRCSIRSASTF